MDLAVDFTSLDAFRVDVEAAGGYITCRCCQWCFLKASTRTVPFPQHVIRVPGLIAPLLPSLLHDSGIKLNLELLKLRTLNLNLARYADVQDVEDNLVY